MILTRFVKRSPHRLSDKQSHGMNPILFVYAISMINPLGQRDQVARLDLDGYPFMGLVVNAEESRSAEDVSYFFGVVVVFFEEGFDLSVSSFDFLDVARGIFERPYHKDDME